MSQQCLQRRYCPVLDNKNYLVGAAVIRRGRTAGPPERPVLAVLIGVIDGELVSPTTMKKPCTGGSESERSYRCPPRSGRPSIRSWLFSSE
jgi:hypothetical protein